MIKLIKEIELGRGTIYYELKLDNIVLLLIKKMVLTDEYNYEFDISEEEWSLITDEVIEHCYLQNSKKFTQEIQQVLNKICANCECSLETTLQEITEELVETIGKIDAEYYEIDEEEKSKWSTISEN